MAARPKDGREEKICVAQIGAAHGLKGEVRLFSFTENPADIATFGPFLLRDGVQQLVLSSIRPAKDHFVARFEGVDDRNAAEMLRNKELCILRSKLPALREDDTFYHADLIGITVTYDDGSVAGEIVAVHNFGAGDILEIKPPDGRDTVLLPFTDQTVPEVDIAVRKVVIAPPAETSADDADAAASAAQDG